MRVLVIGGTQFVGRHTVERLLAAGHEVVLVNRGKTGRALFERARRIVCDRGSDEFYLNIKKEDRFDAVIDFCAYYPKDIERFVPLLPGLAGHYIQISSISAYRASQERPSPFIRDDSPLLECTEEQAVDQTPDSYGNRKARCEQVAMGQSHEGVPVTIFRPCVIYGRWDPTDRFAYWNWRVARQEPFLLPDDGLCVSQRTYAPDFAQTIVNAIGCERAFHKAYTIAESAPLSLRDTLGLIGRHLQVDPFKFAVPVSAERLLKSNVKPWIDLPLWIPQTNRLVDTFRVRGDLELRETPVDNAIGEACDAFLELDRQPSAGMSAEYERKLLRELEWSDATGGQQLERLI